MAQFIAIMTAQKLNCDKIVQFNHKIVIFSRNFIANVTTVANESSSSGEFEKMGIDLINKCYDAIIKSTKSSAKKAKVNYRFIILKNSFLHINHVML